MTRLSLIGATGLIGSKVLAHWPADKPLLALARSGDVPRHPDWRIKHGVMEDWPGLLKGESVDVAIATIGTTWAKVQDWGRFEAIDRHATTAFLKAAKAAGARHAILVSSTMADEGSGNEYLAIKGRTEADARALGFQRLDIIRPGLLRGERGKERRIGERVGIIMSPLVNRLLHGRFHKYRGIDADTVARAMVALALTGGEGKHIHHNRELERLSSS